MENRGENPKILTARFDRYLETNCDFVNDRNGRVGHARRHATIDDGWQSTAAPVRSGWSMAESLRRLAGNKPWRSRQC
jgi:hypothetical protein